MKTLCAALAACVLALGPAHAASTNLAKVTCKVVLDGTDEKGYAMLAAWLYAYYSEADAPVFDFDKIVERGRRLATFCRDNPNSNFIAAAEKVYKK